ncbi:hypothetical protein ES705_37163 [subsurface metagenome]
MSWEIWEIPAGHLSDKRFLSRIQHRNSITGLNTGQIPGVHTWVSGLSQMIIQIQPILRVILVVGVVVRLTGLKDKLILLPGLVIQLQLRFLSGICLRSGQVMVIMGQIFMQMTSGL